jgi:hypothetical protein
MTSRYGLYFAADLVHDRFGKRVGVIETSLGPPHAPRLGRGRIPRLLLDRSEELACTTGGLDANPVPADSPLTESAVSTHQELGYSRTAGLRSQNTADRAQIPGKDGGRRRKLITEDSGRNPGPHAP